MLTTHIIYGLGGLTIGILLTALIARQWCATIREESYQAGIAKGRDLERLTQTKAKYARFLTGED